MTILLCEDDQSIRGMLCVFLIESGFDVTDFASADEALNNSETDLRQFTTVLTDDEMPGTKGNQFARQMRSLNLRSQIIIMSGSYKHTDEDRALNIEFLAKPFSIHDLLAQLSDTPKIVRQLAA